MKCNKCIHSKSCIVSAICRTVEECTRFEPTRRCADCEYCISKYITQCGRTICRLHDAIVNVNHCCEQFLRKGVNEEMSAIEKIRKFKATEIVKAESKQTRNYLLERDGTVDDIIFKKITIETLIGVLLHTKPELIDELYNEIFGDKE